MREFTITDTKGGDWEHRVKMIQVLKAIPDLSNDELERIVDLQVQYSIDIDNITVIRTK